MRTGNKPADPRCPLGTIQSEPMDAAAIKKAAWHNEQIFVISMQDARLKWDEMQFLKNLGDRLYGK